jgi:hypothetical protein
LTASARFTTIARVSQYPPPSYSTPPYAPASYGSYAGYSPPVPADLLAPAKRAAILQGILGVLVSLCGVFIGAAPWFINMSEIAANAGVEIGPVPQGWTVQEVLRLGYTIVGSCGFGIGAVLLILCFFVRNGGAGPAITSIVLEGLIALLLCVNLISSVVKLGSQPALAGLSAVLILIPLALIAVNVVWLIGAARNAGQISYTKAQYQSQYYMYQQQHQVYAQPGGVPYPPGYQTTGYAPPAAPPSMQPPAPPQLPAAFDHPAQPGGPDEPPAATQ